MLRFFRKIRQRLLADNKFSKYLLYAVGEILLVMIGILLALQVNNWNEARKATKQEIKILTELKNDLETNHNEIKESYERTKERQKSAVLILNYLKEGLPIDDSLKRAFESIKGDVIFNIANTSYKFVESQGINTLSNDSLRIRITEMFERHLKNIRTREDRNRNIVDSELIPLMYERFKSSLTIDADFSFSNENLNMPVDIKSLREDAIFRNGIIRLQDWLLVRLYWQKEALSSVEQLISDMQDEIERLTH